MEGRKIRPPKRRSRQSYPICRLRCGEAPRQATGARSAAADFGRRAWDAKRPSKRWTAAMTRSSYHLTADSSSFNRGGPENLDRGISGFSA
jgi:hypothetical protein